MKYVANPVEVEAFKIIGRHTEGLNGSITLTLDDYREVQCTPDMMSRYVPKIGDYWVVQSDGYTYLNPVDVFERKYRRVDA